MSALSETITMITDSPWDTKAFADKNKSLAQSEARLQFSSETVRGIMEVLDDHEQQEGNPEPYHTTHFQELVLEASIPNLMIHLLWGKYLVLHPETLDRTGELDIKPLIEPELMAVFDDQESWEEIGNLLIRILVQYHEEYMQRWQPPSSDIMQVFYQRSRTKYALQCSIDYCFLIGMRCGPAISDLEQLKEML